MYDADYESYLKEAEEKARAAFEGRFFVTKDSGKMAEHSDGVVRDTQEGKTKYTLMFPEGVPMKDQLIVRIAELYTRGGEKYGDRNWEDSCSEDTLRHHTEALWRHFMNFFFGVQDGEDHAAAIVWNVNAVDLTRRNIAKKEAEVPNPFPEKLMAGEIPTWAKHSAKCCGEPFYSSLPFRFRDSCGKGEIASQPLDPNKTDLGDGVTMEIDPEEWDDNTSGTNIFKSYLFPYIGPDTASTGKYHQKEIQANSYSEAKGLFDNWLSGQPFYNAFPDIPDLELSEYLTTVPEADLDWSEGDVLEEDRESLDGKPYCWVYERRTDTWKYHDSQDKEPAPESARSLKKLCKEFGPLKCTKGSNTGRIVGGA